jgi:streptomycin 6-kinase
MHNNCSGESSKECMQEFENNVIGVWGKEGEEWLKNLPNLVKYISDNWHLQNLKPVDNLSYNYVLQGTRVADELLVVVKISCDAIEFNQEVNALKSYQNSGSCIPILEVNYDCNAFLMPQAIPGDSLATLFPQHDDLAIKYACSVISNLHSVSIDKNIEWPTLRGWLKCFDHTKTSILPKEHLHKAKKLVSYLLSEKTKNVLLHGDLHYDNLIKQGNKWIAIDPKGVVGDPAFEIGNVCVRRKDTSVMNAEKMIQRFNTFSRYLSLDAQRVISWAYVQAVMQACWSVQDNGDPVFSIKIANVLKSYC